MATQKYYEWQQKYYAFTKIDDNEERKTYLDDLTFFNDTCEYLGEEGQYSVINYFTEICYQTKKEIFDQVEYMKPLTKININAIKYSNLNSDVEAMRELANQEGIHPEILCYADSPVQNDPGFVTSVIINARDFLDFETSTDDYGSKFRYKENVGKDIQTNPMFWELLNAVSRKKLGYDLLDSSIELECAIKRFEEHNKEDLNTEEFKELLTPTIWDNKNQDIVQSEIFKDKDNVISEEKIIVELKKDEYFDEGVNYIATFTYSSQEQARYMKEMFDKQLCPSVGVNSPRYNEGKDIIKPYLVDEFGNFTTVNSPNSRVGGTNVPEDLLEEFVRRMVEVDKCKIKCGEYEMIETYNPETFGGMFDQLNSGKGQK